MTAGEVFTSVSSDLKRPVEVLGLVHIAAVTGAAESQDPGETDLFEALRPDGSRRSFTTARTIFTGEQLSALESGDQGGWALDD